MLSTGNIDIDMPVNHYDAYSHRHVDVDGTVLLGENCQISAGVKMVGNVVIGDNCYIGPNVTLEDTIIWPGSVK